MKRCPECRQEKPMDSFHKSASHPSGVAPRCIPCAIKVAGDWYIKNKFRKQAYDAKRRAENRHLYRSASRRFRQNRKDRKNADTAVRRDRVKQATASWANKFFIKQAYELAALRTKMFGFKWEVDHVIPLRGKNVCGLHVETNLKVVPAVINQQKRNHYSSTRDGIK